MTFAGSFDHLLFQTDAQIIAFGSVILEKIEQMAQSTSDIQNRCVLQVADLPQHDVTALMSSGFGPAYGRPPITVLREQRFVEVANFPLIFFCLHFRD